MKITISLTSEQIEMLKPLHKEQTKSLMLDFNKCSAFCQYYNLFNNRNTKIVKDNDNILHAHEYDKNDNNTFWLILTKELVMVDLCIPNNIDLTNQQMLLNLSPDEIKIVSKIVK